MTVGLHHFKIKDYNKKLNEQTCLTCDKPYENDIHRLIEPSDPRGRSHHAAANLAEALETYRVRNKLYGNNYKRFGAVMAALYPDAGSANCVNMTADQWNRLGVIVQIVSKLTRYVADPAVGHLDSIHDIMPYAAMLEEIDAELQDYSIAGPDHLPKQISIEEMLQRGCEHIWSHEPDINDPMGLYESCVVVGCGAKRPR